jgi:aspartyl/glutamyl-tRNA(Asn/Gln) amidotransferase C subunit
VIDRDVLAKICGLAKLKVGDEKDAPFLDDLNAVFEWVAQLTQIDVSGSGLNVADDVKSTPERDDTPAIRNTRKDILGNTQFQKFDMFYVPKIVE